MSVSHLTTMYTVNYGFNFRVGGQSFPIRLYLTNESGYYLSINLYREVTDPRTGLVSILSIRETSFKDFYDPTLSGGGAFRLAQWKTGGIHVS